MTTTPVESPYLTTAEAAALIRISVKWVQKACHAGDLPAVKTGKEWRIHRRDLDRFMGGTPAPAEDRHTRNRAR